MVRALPEGANQDGRVSAASRARQDGFGARGRCDVCGVDASPTILWYLEERTAGRWKRNGERTERCSDHPADRLPRGEAADERPGAGGSQPALDAGGGDEDEQASGAPRVE